MGNKADNDMVGHSGIPHPTPQQLAESAAQRDEDQMYEKDPLRISDFDKPEIEAAKRAKLAELKTKKPEPGAIRPENNTSPNADLPWSFP